MFKTKMKNKILSMIITTALVGLIFCGCDAPHQAAISDFVITINLLKDSVAVGENVEAEIQFVNLTDKKYDAVYFGDEGESSFIGIHLYSGGETLPAVEQKEALSFTIKPNEVINSKRSIDPIGQGEYYCYAYAFFKIGNESFFIKSEKIKVTVEEKKQDYVLNISSDKQIYAENEEIFIDISFENRSGSDVEIAYYLLFYPESSTGQFPEIELAPVTIKKLFKNNETIHEVDRLGGCFLVGHHKLQYRAIFYLTWEMTESGYENTYDRVEVYSNTIEFSVVESLEK